MQYKITLGTSFLLPKLYFLLLEIRFVFSLSCKLSIFCLFRNENFRCWCLGEPPRGRCMASFCAVRKTYAPRVSPRNARARSISTAHHGPTSTIFDFVLLHFLRRCGAANMRHMTKPRFSVCSQVSNYV